MSFIKDLQQVLRQNIREYGMYIALFVIMAIFTITTDGVFISLRNISNLLNQTGYIAVLAVGMTLVIVIRHIDLSVGFLAGFIGAIAAIGLHPDLWGLPALDDLPSHRTTCRLAPYPMSSSLLERTRVSTKSPTQARFWA